MCEQGFRLYQVQNRISEPEYENDMKTDENCFGSDHSTLNIRGNFIVSAHSGAAAQGIDVNRRNRFRIVVKLSLTGRQL
mgnify:CR=1 FL=1